MGYSDKTWYVGSSGLKYYPCVLLSMCILSTSFAYLFWLVNNTNANIKSSIWAAVMKLGMWVEVDSSITHVLNVHNQYLICIFILIG